MTSDTDEDRVFKKLKRKPYSELDIEMADLFWASKLDLGSFFKSPDLIRLVAESGWEWKDFVNVMVTKSFVDLSYFK